MHTFCKSHPLLLWMKKFQFWLCTKLTTEVSKILLFNMEHPEVPRVPLLFKGKSNSCPFNIGKVLSSEQFRTKMVDCE